MPGKLQLRAGGQVLPKVFFSGRSHSIHTRAADGLADSVADKLLYCPPFL